MKNQRQYIVWLPLLFGLVAALGLVTGYQLAGAGGRWNIQSNRSRSSIQEVMDLLKNRYVDSLPLDSLESASVNALLTHLDPHSVYIPPADVDEVNADISGGFFGIGVEYQMIRDTMNLVYVLEQGPGDKAGLQVGDQVVSVNGEKVAGIRIKNDQLRGKIRGANNTKVQLGIVRNGQAMTKEVIRGNVPLPSVDASYMLSKDIGYIRLNKFAETTYKEFMDAATGLQKQGMKKLVLDLRSNGGGILDQATNIADELLEDGLNLVTIKGMHTKETTITSSKPGILEEAPVVVLLDEFSASASEVLAAALQDNDRGTIMGTRSFGKGLVQEQYDLHNGGALRLTVARYYTPTGRSIQKPYTGDLEAYHDEVINRFARPDSANAGVDTTKVFTTRKGKKLYGGGGVTPDIVLNGDTLSYNFEERLLFNPNLISDFSFELYKQHQQQVKSSASPSKFYESFSMSSPDWDRFAAAARADSIKVTTISEKTKKDLELRIKANMARFVWRSNGFFTIIQQGDKQLKSAIDFLSKQ